MAVSLVSTVPAVQTAFVTAARLEVPAGVTVHRTWPGPDATAEMVFCTEIEWTSTELAAIGPQRQMRDEIYAINFEVWSLSETASPSTGGDAIDRLFTIYDSVEESVAKAASTFQSLAGVQFAVCSPQRVDIVEFAKGWGAAMQARLAVKARLS